MYSCSFNVLAEPWHRFASIKNDLHVNLFSALQSAAHCSDVVPVSDMMDQVPIRKRLPLPPQLRVEVAEAVVVDARAVEVVVELGPHSKSQYGVPELLASNSCSLSVSPAP